VSFSTPFSSSQKINYNWHGDTIGIRSSSCGCCKSWLCWLIELHAFRLLSPGAIQNSEEEWGGLHAVVKHTTNCQTCWGLLWMPVEIN
jgi:hypothetical protein